MSYIYGAPILDVSRSHTTTQQITGPSSIRSKKNTGRKIGWLTIILRLLASKDVDTVVLLNVSNYLLNKTVSHLRRTESLTLKTLN